MSKGESRVVRLKLVRLGIEGKYFLINLGLLYGGQDP
jgi:hypothetical protein